MAVLIFNKKAKFNYEILEKMTAGIELFGFEVKSLRQKLGSLDGAYITVRGGEAYIIGFYIPPFQPNNTPKDYDPQRVRRILLTKKEITELGDTENKKGLTIVPISVYNEKRWIKIEVAAVRGKKKADKRETIKKRELDRELKREFKDR